MNINNNLPVFYEGLKIMVFGMTGIFLVLSLLFAAIKALLKIFPSARHLTSDKSHGNK
ncbi:OadG family protein [Clostridium polynesiense]|uniref:OadG family protein n=1 Tax=Clostridium polynesiense TaxID=1325933 RepID=UPI000B0CEF98|nr:OadG family protein [Clostridium polynesiense]